jgi:hypothetical protein
MITEEEEKDSALPQIPPAEEESIPEPEILPVL